jgi:hypothetical protein
MRSATSNLSSLLKTVCLGAFLTFGAACADCGGPGADAGPDGGGDDAGGGQCGFIGSSCSGDDADCCGDLLCNESNVCANPPTCTDDDALAGTPGDPAALTGIQPADEMHACSGFENIDVFTIDAAAGDLLRVTMQTVGFAENAQVGQGESDIDIILLTGPPTGIDAQGNVEGPSVAGGVTVSATERIVYEVETAGTFYVAVVLFAGPEADYTLTASTEGKFCDFDADCGMGFDYCRTGVDPDSAQVVQECATWTDPGCGDGAEEGGGDIHSDTNAFAIDGSVDASICPGDIDVFTFDKAVGDLVFVDVSASAIPANEFLVATVVDSDGAVLDVLVAADGQLEDGMNLGAGADAGTYYVYVDHFVDGAANDLSYNLDVKVLPSCRTDADCTDGDVCGYFAPGTGRLQACTAPVADPCGADNDTDNSETTANVLTSGTGADGNSCIEGPDYYKITLPGPINDLNVDLTWTDANADLDVYVYGPDGTALGAGWYGSPGENWQANSLPPGDYYIVVDTFACGFDNDGAIFCDSSFSYNVEATYSAANDCTADNQCVAGGTTVSGDNSDPSVELVCDTAYMVTQPVPPTDAGPPADAGQPVDAGEPADAGDVDGGDLDAGPETDAGAQTPVDAGMMGGADGGVVTVGACVRSSPAYLLSQQGGEECFDGLDCASVFCIDSYCTGFCGEDADCDSALGGANAGYCMDLVQNPFCLMTCTGNEDCDRVFGTGSTVCTSGECTVP